MPALTISGVAGRVVDAATTFNHEIGSPKGFCAIRIVKIALFPKFKKEFLTVHYPFDW